MILIGAVALAGCDLAPDYHPPDLILPANYHGTGPFQPAATQDQFVGGLWWKIFGDADLDRLEEDLVRANPDLKAAEETYTQARDIVGEARAGLYPQVTTQGLLSSNRQSEHRLFRNGTSGPNVATSNEIEAAATWEPDFWDEIRNRTKYSEEQAQGEAAALASARLSLEAQLASAYISMRTLDAEHAVYRQTISFYEEAVSITQMRFNAKISAELDVARSNNQLAAAEALDTETLAQREVLQHGIAVLAGMNPTDFTLPIMADARMTIPTIPAGVPSTLLQRRPDIAQAEREMAAANAQIGVARAAFYPNIRLSATGGFEDTGFNLASLPNSLWALGAQAMLPLFEGGLRKAELQRTWSVFAQTSDEYKSTVLTAFQQVEDGLVLTQQLAVEAQQQAAAVRAATEAQKMTLTLYTGGLDNYLDADVSQIAALTAEIAEVEVQGRRLSAAVSLVRALGGGWSTNKLPFREQTLPFNPLDPFSSPEDVKEPIEAASDVRQVQ